MTADSLLRSPAHPPEDAEVTGRRWMTGAVLLIVADASFVAALSFTFLYLRGVNTEGAFHPPKSTTASLVWPWLITVCMVAGFAAYSSGLGRAGQPVRSRFAGGAALGLVFMTVALVLNIVQMVTFPFRVVDNAYSSAVFVIAAGNVFHLLVTLFTGVGAVNRARRGLTQGLQQWPLRIVGLWWGWVCLASAVGALTISVANGIVS
jgi:hypothetical protein